MDTSSIALCALWNFSVDFVKDSEKCCLGISGGLRPIISSPLPLLAICQLINVPASTLHWYPKKGSTTGQTMSDGLYRFWVVVYDHICDLLSEASLGPGSYDSSAKFLRRNISYSSFTASDDAMTRSQGPQSVLEMSAPDRKS